MLAFAPTDEENLMMSEAEAIIDPESLMRAHGASKYELSWPGC